MYIRKVKQINKDTGKEYYTHRLAETYRNAAGKVRQRVLLNLGTHFSVPQENWKKLADRIETILSGQQILFLPADEIENEAQSIAKRIVHRDAKVVEVGAVAEQHLVPEQQEKDYQAVDVNSLEHQQPRQIGAEYVGYSMLKQLEFEQLLSDLNFNRKQINTAIGSMVGRLVAPGSERATQEYLRTGGALDELLGCNFHDLKKDSLYDIADKLLCKKNIIEKRLFQKEKSLFQLDEIITLYDLTNTYFEGKSDKNSNAAYGRSKEKRGDCPLVTLALVLDASGFPKKSEIFAGNVSEPKTLSQVIKRLENSENNLKPIIIFDAGISSEENISWLKNNGYRYIAVSKKNEIKEVGDDYVELRHKKDYSIKAKLVKDETTLENKLYCYSEMKEKKEWGIRDQAELRYENELEKLSAGLKKNGTTKKYVKILEKIGRLKEKHKRVSFAYEVQVIADKEGVNAVAIRWTHVDSKQKTPGIYCLRSDCDNLGAQEMWDIYIMLTELEDAFRCLKSELGLRPIYHQITKRVDSHIFISVLAYHLLHTIRYQLKMHGINERWETIKKELRTHIRITSTLQCKDGRKLHIRKNSLPNPRQIQIYRALNLPTSIPLKAEKSFF